MKSPDDVASPHSVSREVSYVPVCATRDIKRRSIVHQIHRVHPIPSYPRYRLHKPKTTEGYVIKRRGIKEASEHVAQLNISTSVLISL